MPACLQQSTPRVPPMPPAPPAPLVRRISVTGEQWMEFHRQQTEALATAEMKAAAAAGACGSAPRKIGYQQTVRDLGSFCAYGIHGMTEGWRQPVDAAISITSTIFLSAYVPEFCLTYFMRCIHLCNIFCQWNIVFFLCLQHAMKSYRFIIVSMINYGHLRICYVASQTIS